MSASVIAVLALLGACAAIPFLWMRFDSQGNSSQRRLASVSLLLLGLFVFGYFAATALPGEVDFRLDPTSKESLGWVYPLICLAAFIGKPSILIVMAIVMTASALAAGSARRAWTLLAVVAGEFATCALLKHTIGRARPAGNLEAAADLAFPSAHASNCVLVYGALLVMLTQTRRLAPLRGLLSAAYVVFITGMGASRILMRAHSGLDVLSGLAWGAYWLALLVLVWNGAWCSSPPKLPAQIAAKQETLDAPAR
ncbi:MAG: phosphatase PAP2 family protein [Candidatus Wallbacteria bacterium]|nr:phosphatase PAP2 family protein [Candidatus Wallbacteria bacterium]